MYWYSENIMNSQMRKYTSQKNEKRKTIPEHMSFPSDSTTSRRIDSKKLKKLREEAADEVSMYESFRATLREESILGSQKRSNRFSIVSN